MKTKELENLVLRASEGMGGMIKPATMRDLVEAAERIKESRKPKKWQPKGGSYCLDIKGNIFKASVSTAPKIYTHLGITGTREECQRIFELRKTREIINARIRELNKEDGFVVDWNCYSQKKYYIFYSHRSGLWSGASSLRFEIVGIEYCSKLSIDIITKELNNDLIEGVEK